MKEYPVSDPLNPSAKKKRKGRKEEVYRHGDSVLHSGGEGKRERKGVVPEEEKKESGVDDFSLSDPPISKEEKRKRERPRLATILREKEKKKKIRFRKEEGMRSVASPLTVAADRAEKKRRGR